MIINNPKLMLPNFRGLAQNHNPAGNRVFWVVLEGSQIDEAVERGFDVRGTDYRYIKVTLPAQTSLEPIIASLLDAGRLELEKITIAGLPWTVAERSGVKAFAVDFVIAEIW